jgi:hypothetical protein
MVEDFPAAHSQDTEWYAIDQHGHVAVFESGENGHVPEEAQNQYLLDELWRFQHPEEGEDAYHDTGELVSHFGVFYFTYGDDFDPIGPYNRAVVPDKPLHVDQLPPQLRKRCKQIRFESLAFYRAEYVQPLEFFPCVFWYSDRVAYLCGDGKTVRPIPGQEDAFADFCRELQSRQPDWAKTLHFEMSRPEEGEPGEKEEA